MGYAPPRGPSVNLQLRYNHREENQPQTFTFANLGARWTMNDHLGSVTEVTNMSCRARWSPALRSIPGDAERV